MRKSFVAIPLVAAALLVGCSTPTQDANARDKSAMEQSQRNMLEVQPTPVFGWSQMRQTLIDAETAAAEGTQTTSFFFARGSVGGDGPIGQCPSIGFPVPASWNITNPNKMESHNGEPYTIPQQEPTGIYTAESSGTYVVCVSPGGQRYVSYVEADVVTVGGAAEWVDGEIKVVGEPTVTSNQKPQ